MMFKYAIDPSLFLWDEVNYDTLKTEYYEIASYLIDAITIIENYPVCITKEIVELVLDKFPFDSISSTEHRELVSILCSFLSKLLSSPETDRPDINGIKMVPTSLCYQTHAAHKAVIDNILHEWLIDNADMYFVTHYNLWDKSKTAVLLQLKKTQKTIQTVANYDSLQQSTNSFGRIYEPSKKHMLGGFGSLLEIDDEHASRLLQDAINISETSDALINRYINETDETIYVIFRRHLNNKYHAYPEVPFKIPQKIKERLLV